MDIFFCDACAARVTDTHLRRGHGLRAHDVVICAKCIENGHGRDYLEKAKEQGRSISAEPELAGATVLNELRDRKQTQANVEEVVLSTAELISDFYEGSGSRDVLAVDPGFRPQAEQSRRASTDDDDTDERGIASSDVRPLGPTTARLVNSLGDDDAVEAEGFDADELDIDETKSGLEQLPASDGHPAVVSALSEPEQANQPQAPDLGEVDLEAIDIGDETQSNDTLIAADAHPDAVDDLIESDRQDDGLDSDDDDDDDDDEDVDSDDDDDDAEELDISTASDVEDATRVYTVTEAQRVKARTMGQEESMADRPARSPFSQRPGSHGKRPATRNPEAGKAGKKKAAQKDLKKKSSSKNGDQNRGRKATTQQSTIKSNRTPTRGGSSSATRRGKSGNKKPWLGPVIFVVGLALIIGGCYGTYLFFTGHLSQSRELVIDPNHDIVHLIKEVDGMVSRAMAEKEMVGMQTAVRAFEQCRRQVENEYTPYLKAKGQYSDDGVTSRLQSIGYYKLVKKVNNLRMILNAQENAQ
jgi:hypothetical protein